MHEALCVNPYEIGNVASMLHRALTMPIEEREVRMTALRYFAFVGKIIDKTQDIVINDIRSTRTKRYGPHGH